MEAFYAHIQDYHDNNLFKAIIHPPMNRDLNVFNRDVLIWLCAHVLACSPEKGQTKDKIEFAPARSVYDIHSKEVGSVLLTVRK